jgi:hypothetical protein
MGCYEKATACTREQPGARALYDYILRDSHGVLAGLGIYNCRPPRLQVSGYSTHAEGRALDITANPVSSNSIPVGSLADVAVRSWRAQLVQNYRALGVQRILYKSDEWRCDLGWRTVSVSLAKLHQNHMHVELTRASARSLTTAQIDAALKPGDQDMTPAQEKKLDAVLTFLNDTFGVDAAGQAKDIRLKIDKNYIGLYGDDHADMVAGRVLALEQKMDAVLNHLGIPDPTT